MNISFSGCGFAGMYHVGVVTCLRKHAPQLVARLQTISGASAGSLAALMLASGMPVDTTIELILASSRRAQSLWFRHMSPFFDLIGEVKANLSSSLPDDAHVAVSGRLYISLTFCNGWRNVLVSQFESKEDLIQAAASSCYVPLWARLFPVVYRGKYVMDGGFSNNMPQDFPGEMITVSPFSGETDICPESPGDLDLTFEAVNMTFMMSLSNVTMLKQALILPDSQALVELALLGYNDCLQFLQLRGWDECTCYDRGDCCPLECWEELIPEKLHHLVVGRVPHPLCATDSLEDEQACTSEGSAVTKLIGHVISGLAAVVNPLKRLAILKADDSCI